MESLIEVLKKARARFPSLSKRIEEAEALVRWELAVGPVIAKNSKAVKVQDGVLWVEVSHPIWKSELHHRKHQILAILNMRNEEAKQPVLLDLLFIEPRRELKREPWKK